MLDPFWQDNHVLVTGAGGFIGSHLTEKLLESGAQVRAFIRYNSRKDPGLLKLLPGENRNRLELVYGDLRDLDAVQQAMQEIQLVIHLGAQISIPYSYKHPVDVVGTNALGTLNVLLACRDNRVKRLVHISSSEVYGSALRTPMDESHPLQGQSPYSASKIAADKLAESFYCSYGTPVVTVRPFNTYGPRQSARAVIPTIIAQALNQEKIRLGNLTTRRDFTYVDDTVNGILQAARVEGIEGETFNLGSGQEIEIGVLAQKILQLIGRPVEIIQEDQRLRPEKSEVNRLLSDNSLARARLAWQPLTDLEAGLQNTITWFKEIPQDSAASVYEY